MVVIVVIDRHDDTVVEVEVWIFWTQQCYCKVRVVHPFNAGLGLKMPSMVLLVTM